MINYLNGPTAASREAFRDGYRNEPSITELVDAVTDLAATIDHWLCGPRDDGDESQECILANAVERAARFIESLPCGCDPDGELCQRCLALGCDHGEHKSDNCPSTNDPVVLDRKTAAWEWLHGEPASGEHESGSPVDTSPDLPPAWSDLIEGLTLMATGQSNDISPLHCEHDVLSVSADAAKFTREQLSRLDALGFSVDEDGYFYSFRFGSA